MSDVENDTDDTSDGLAQTAATLINQLNTFNDKVTAMRTARNEDPDSLGDKIITLVIPSIAGLVAGKVFESLWNANFSRRAADIDASDDGHKRQGVVMSLLFAALSAAFGAVVSQLSDRGSRSLVTYRQHRRAAKRG